MTPYDAAAAKVDGFIQAREEARRDGAEVLNDVLDHIVRFVVLPSHEAEVAATLWVAHTHLVSVLESTPRFLARSAEPWSGKTRLVEEVFSTLVPNPLTTANASPAAIWRVLDAGIRDGTPPTLLFDEIDTIFKPARGDDPTAELRGVINAGHRRGATVVRCVGPRHTPTEFEVFAPVALAGLSRVRLADSTLSRSIVIDMRRRKTGDKVEPFRFRIHSQEGYALRDRLAAWSAAVINRAADYWPEMPEGVEDRPADVWEPLLIVADLAGGYWPELARKACVEFVRASSTDDASLGVKLLEHLRELFGDAIAMHTKTILGELNDNEEAPWAEINHGKPLNGRGLARLLKQYGVKSKQVQVGGISLKGYHVDGDTGLADAWERYLAGQGKQGKQGKHDNPHSETDVSLVSHVSHTPPGGEEEEGCVEV